MTATQQHEQQEQEEQDQGGQERDVRLPTPPEGEPQFDPNPILRDLVHEFRDGSGVFARHRADQTDPESSQQDDDNQGESTELGGEGT